MKFNKGPLQVFLGSALWGTDAVFRTQLTKVFSSLHIVFFEHIFGALFSFPLMVKNSRLFKKMNKLDWLSLFYIALGGGVIATFFITQSFKLAFQFGNINVPVLASPIALLIANATPSFVNDKSPFITDVALVIPKYAIS